MFYRRKIILALLELFEGELEKLRLQKLLFLFSQRQNAPVYDFVPYKYGCFSWSANADLTTMAKKGTLEESKTHFISKERTSFFQQLKPLDRKLLEQVKKNYGAMDANALMRHTYINFPFWAIKSVKAESLLKPELLKRVTAKKPVQTEIMLFTIGYEGISLEAYFNKLIKENVKVLVDVRRNPLSMKYGFSKSTLKRCCEVLELQYIHLPEVGIDSSQRQELNDQSDYDQLFEIYKKENLAKTQSVQNQILKYLKENKRIALTCFEAKPCQCHRSYLAEAISQLPGFKYDLKHL